MLADKTEALVELLRATQYDAVVLGFPLLGDVCNEKAAGELYTMGREHAQPPTEGLLAALQPRASYIWRSTPLFNEWHMRDHCLATPLVLAANARQARRYAAALPGHSLLDATQLAPLYLLRHVKSQRQHVHADMNDLLAQQLLATLDGLWRGGGAKHAAAWRAPAPEVPPWSSIASRRARARYDAEHAAPPTTRRRRKPRKGKRKVKGRSY